VRLLVFVLGWLSMASILVGMVTYTSLYPVMLIVPVLLSTKKVSLAIPLFVYLFKFPYSVESKTGKIFFFFNLLENYIKA